MRNKISTTVLALLMLCIGLSSPVQAQEVTDEAVRGVIRRMITELLASQKPDGTWESEKGGAHNQEGGETAVVTYALLSAGVSHQDPKMRKALDWLMKYKLVPESGVYAVGCRSHVWGQLPDKFERYHQNDLYWLLKAGNRGPAGKAFHYSQVDTGYDNSVTQYGMLGVWEARKRNLAVGMDFWRGIEEHFLKTQLPDGSWEYVEGSGPRGTMTAAGLTCLYVTRDYLHGMKFKVPGTAAKHGLEPRIEKGLESLGKGFVKGGQFDNGHYYLYGIERVGLAGGHKRIGGVDWYRKGAATLMANPGSDPWQKAFTLLFLSRGRVPVFISKLEIPGYEWNNRPSDVKNLAHWVSDIVENEMNWQVVSINEAPETWLDSPLLFLGGHLPLALDEKQVARLKRYIDLGGTVITHADDGRQPFNKSVTDLLAVMYPDYKLANVPVTDDVFNINFKVNPGSVGLQSIHNGSRHILFHFPQKDVAWTWQSKADGDEDKWNIMANLFYYATEKGRVKPRLAEHYEAPKNSGGPAVKVGLAQYGGNWNPEPLSWEVLSTYAGNRNKGTFQVTTVKLDELDKAEVSFVHVKGTADVTFSEKEIESVKAFAAKGGVILFENVGGKGTGGFDKSVQKMLRAAYKDNNKLWPRTLPGNLDFFSGKSFDGFDCTAVTLRPYAILRSSRNTASIPEMLGCLFDGQPRIIISPNDLSTGAVGHAVWGVYGYRTMDARRLLANMALWGAKMNPK